jgi:hypothetical protein
MTRISKKDLNSLVDRINLIFLKKDRYCLGAYDLSIANGGYALHQIVTLEGGELDVFSIGHVPARELFNLMNAFIIGLKSEDIEQQY